jgi:hypothetical protein
MARVGRLERVAHGVYRLRGAPPADHVELRAAWLQLAPSIPAWERTLGQGVVSHRSAALLYGLGELPADVHEFTVPARRQTRRADVRLHRRNLDIGDVRDLGELPGTRPGRIAADLLIDGADAEAVARILAEAMAVGMEDPAEFVRYLAPLARRFGWPVGDGVAVVAWLLDLSGITSADRSAWLDQARTVPVRTGR